MHNESFFIIYYNWEEIQMKYNGMAEICTMNVGLGQRFYNS